MREGIEIEYDDKGRRLYLACEPDAFARFQAVARNELRDLPDIPVDQAIYLEITDTERHVARRDSPRNYPFNALVVLGLFAVGVPWTMGVIWFVRWLISNKGTAED